MVLLLCNQETHNEEGELIMLRIMDCVKEFDNHNLNIKFDEMALELAEHDDVMALAEVLEQADCYLIGESFCLSNWAMGHLIYNFYSDMCYIFNWADLDDLKAGRTIKIYAHIPDDDERKEIEEEGY